MQFIDLKAQHLRLADRINARIAGVLEKQAFIQGPDVKELEAALAGFSGAKHVVSCANGTDALQVALMALGVGQGDAVFVPSFTYTATAEVVLLLGATPVFVEVDPTTFNLDMTALDAAIERVKAEGKLNPTCLFTVDLFGMPVDYDRARAICDTHGIAFISDAAQGFGASYKGRRVGSGMADITTTSFFPAKPLGCYGDGGAVLSKDARLHDLLVSLRVHGQAVKSDLEGRTFDHDPKYLNMRIGMNARMDTIQAAVLLQKLAIFADEIEARNRVADRYNQGLGDVVRTPEVIEGGVSVWAQYTIETDDRDGLAAHLKAAEIPTAVYYPIPIHKQGVYSVYPVGPGGLPATMAAAERVISLPMHPYLEADVQDQIIAAIRAFAGRNA